MNGNSKEILNSGKTLSRLLGDEGFVAELYDAFLQDIDAKVLRIRNAVMKNDYEELGKAAHSLKGACGAIDAERLYSWAWELELAAKAEDGADVTARMAELDAEWSGVKTALDSWIAMQGGK